MFSEPSRGNWSQGCSSLQVSCPDSCWLSTPSPSSSSSITVIIVITCNTTVIFITVIIITVFTTNIIITIIKIGQVYPNLMLNCWYKFGRGLYKLPTTIFGTTFLIMTQGKEMLECEEVCLSIRFLSLGGAICIPLRLICLSRVNMLILVPRPFFIRRKIMNIPMFKRKTNLTFGQKITLGLLVSLKILHLCELSNGGRLGPGLYNTKIERKLNQFHHH